MIIIKGMSKELAQDIKERFNSLYKGLFKGERCHNCGKKLTRWVNRRFLENHKRFLCYSCFGLAYRNDCLCHSHGGDSCWWQEDFAVTQNEYELEKCPSKSAYRAEEHKQFLTRIIKEGLATKDVMDKKYMTDIYLARVNGDKIETLYVSVEDFGELDVSLFSDKELKKLGHEFKVLAVQEIDERQRKNIDDGKVDFICCTDPRPRGNEDN